MAPLEKEPSGAAAQPIQEKKYQDALSLIEKDNKAKRNEYLFETPGFITKWLDKALRDPRDKPMVFLMFNMVSPCRVHDGTSRFKSHYTTTYFSPGTCVVAVYGAAQTNALVFASRP
jgi:hypothetical protein